MGKNARLANIYIKIYNKQVLTMDDLKFLSVYDPECFAKTCKNLVFNIPETKKLMEPEPKKEPEMPVEEVTASQQSMAEQHVDEQARRPEYVDRLFQNIKKLEGDELGVQTVSLDQVKNLLGTLYMEMLFPHNDKDKTFQLGQSEDASIFNKIV